MRKLLFGLIAVLLGFAVPLLAAELALRLLPVASAMRIEPVTAADPIAHYRPDTDFVFSTGWRMERVNRGRTNNVGFINPQDYVTDDPRPLLAVVGDSYIEALMVPYAETIQGRLAAAVGDKGRVYSFGLSGAPLSQYLVWAEYAVKTFKAKGIVITVVGNDFDESLLKYKSRPSQQYFVDKPGGGMELHLVEFHPSLLRRVASASALVRYLMLNMWFMTVVEKIRNGSLAPNNYPHGNPADIPAGLVADSSRAIDEFLKELPERTGLAPSRIVLAVDAVRLNIYDGGKGGEHDAYGTIMRGKLLKDAAAQGFETIDLQSVFSEDWRANHRHFEFPDDGHWSGYGHEVVAKAVMRSRLFTSLFGDQANAEAAPAH